MLLSLEIKKTLNQFGVIFIKKQNLDPDAYQRFAKNIGQPVVYPRLKGLDEKFPFINVIERKPDDKNLSFGFVLKAFSSLPQTAYGRFALLDSTLPVPLIC